MISSQIKKGGKQKANDKISQELVEKAMQCETAEELLKLAKENSIELTMEEAEAYLAEGALADLSHEEMARVAGSGHFCGAEGLGNAEQVPPRPCRVFFRHAASDAVRRSDATPSRPLPCLTKKSLDRATT